MSRPALEVADIVRAHRSELVHARGRPLSSESSRVLSALAACRTAALGGHVQRCDHCAHEIVSYNSCRNRHCPKCQAAARQQWLQQRQRDLLPVPYFHVVFTWPHELSPLVLANRARLYDLLFRCAAQTLQRIAADPRHLGAEIGLLAVLHTWSQTLHHHPHVHCVVPGGGIAPDGQRWVACRPGFFLPVKVLGRLFRGQCLAALTELHRRGELRLHASLAPLQDTPAFREFLRPLYAADWVVHSKPPFGGPEHVLKYLARYTHRVAISNHRLVSLHEGQVTFRYRDPHGGRRPRAMSLGATEFLRRFLLHVLPKSFVRIRHYGFLANRCRQQRLALCRRLLAVSPPPEPTQPQEDERHCPRCHAGVLVEVAVLPRGAPVPPRGALVLHDTS